MDRRPGSVRPLAAVLVAAVLAMLGTLRPAGATTLFDRAGFVDDPVVPANPQAIAFSPDGAHAYVVDSQRDVTFVYARDAVDGGLTPIELEPTTGLEVAVTGDGSHVYVLGSGVLQTHERDASTGELDFVGSESVPQAQTLLVSPTELTST